MKKFKKLCRFKGKMYAVECEGDEHKIGNTTYYINEALDGNGYVVTLGSNGWRVAKNPLKEVLEISLDMIHKNVQPNGLQDAKQVTEAEYKRIIERGKDDGE